MLVSTKFLYSFLLLALRFFNSEKCQPNFPVIISCYELVSHQSNIPSIQCFSFERTPRSIKINFYTSLSASSPKFLFANLHGPFKTAESEGNFSFPGYLSGYVITLDIFDLVTGYFIDRIVIRNTLMHTTSNFVVTGDMRKASIRYSIHQPNSTGLYLANFGKICLVYMTSHPNYFRMYVSANQINSLDLSYEYMTLNLSSVPFYRGPRIRFKQESFKVFSFHENDIFCKGRPPALSILSDSMNVFLIGRLYSNRNLTDQYFMYFKDFYGVYYGNLLSSVKLTNIKLSFYNRMPQMFERNMTTFDICNTNSHWILLTDIINVKCFNRFGPMPTYRNTYNDCFTWKGWDYYSDDVNANPVIEEYPTNVPNRCCEGIPSPDVRLGSCKISLE